MTAAHEENYTNRLLNDAVATLCPIVSAGKKPSGKPVRRNEASVRKYGTQFLSRMLSDTPFKTEDEAIAALAPVSIWIFRFALRQIAIQVIKYLWARLETKSSVTVSTFARRIG